MTVWDFVSVAFGAQSEDRSAPLAGPIRRRSAQHDKPEKSSDDGSPCPHGNWHPKCWCSVATDGVQPITPPVVGGACSLFFPATQATGPTITQTTSVAPAAPPFTSSPNARSTNASPLPSTSLPSQTTTNVASTKHATSSRSFAPISSSGNADASDYSHSLIPTVAATSNAPPAPSYAHRLNTRTVVGIVLGALSLFLVIALALFLFFRRRIQRRGKRMSTESSWRRLKPHPFDDGSSGFISSVWTGFGSVSVDPDVDPRRDPRRHSLGLRFAEKEKDADPERLGLGTYTSGPSPPPAETHPFARKASSVRPLEEGQVRVPHLNIIIPSSSGLGASSNPELLALAGAEYNQVAHGSTRRDGGLEPTGSKASHMTTTTGNVRSMEAL